MHKTLKEIAKLIDGKVVGDEDILITGVSGIKEAAEGDITFLANPKYSSIRREPRQLLLQLRRRKPPSRLF
jgi:UDP-3-O-[3-hydroxymyristoyl] glucosamine N-acyltransferase